MVAVLECARTDAECVDGDATHSFSSFTVYPSPDSRTYLFLNNPPYAPPLMTLVNGRGCGDVFDPVTGSWYPYLEVNPLANASRPGPRPLPAPPAETGSQALVSPAPTPTANCSKKSPPPPVA